MKNWRAILCLFWCLGAAAETIPSAPKEHFVDYTRQVKPAIAVKINGELAELEQRKSIRVLVAVLPQMDSTATIEEYTKRIARAWQAELKQKNAGVILFVFLNSHKVNIATDSALEQFFPDAKCKAILETEVIPRFQKNDLNGGITAGVDAIIGLADKVPVKK